MAVVAGWGGKVDERWAAVGVGDGALLSETLLGITM